MSKGNYFKYEKLKKEFNKAMQEGNIEKARKINDEMNRLVEA